MRLRATTSACHMTTNMRTSARRFSSFCSAVGWCSGGLLNLARNAWYSGSATISIELHQNWYSKKSEQQFTRQEIWLSKYSSNFFKKKKKYVIMKT